MEIVGITTDGKKAVAGLGKFHFEQGLPLVFMFDKCIQNNMMPSWIHLVEELTENGMTKARVHHLLNEHIFEAYGKEFRDHVISLLQKSKLI